MNDTNGSISTKRKKGRPSLYSSPEEKKKSRDEYAKRYYKEHKEEVIRRQMNNYKDDRVVHDFKYKSKYNPNNTFQQENNESFSVADTTEPSTSEEENNLVDYPEKEIDNVEKTREYNKYLKKALETLDLHIKQLQNEAKLIDEICDLITNNDYEAIDELCSQNSPYSFTNYKTVAH